MFKHYSLFFNLACYPRQDGVDTKLHDLNYPQPKPKAHGAPHLREEAGKDELQEVSPGDTYLARETKRNC